MSELKTIIDANIKENGNQEITGKVLNYVLNKIAEGTQKDWNESDATNEEYIKGRTHGVTYEHVSVEGTLKELGYVPGEYVSVLHYARVNGVLEGKGLYLGGLLYNPIVGEEYRAKYEGPSVYARVVEVEDGYDVQIKGSSDTGNLLKVAIVEYKKIDDAYISTDIARKSQVDALEDKVDNLPQGEEFDKQGNYPLLHVGTADDLAGRGESVPASFGFRASGGKSIKDGRAYIKRIKGNSVVWNQKAEKTYIDQDRVLHNIDIIPQNHKFALIRSKAFGGCYYMPSDGVIDYALTDGEYAKIFVQSHVADAEYSRIYSTAESGYIQLIDLTQMFGAGNEPTTIEEFNARVATLGVDLNAYNEGEVIHCNTENIKSVGDNAFNGVWYQGGVSDNDGSINTTQSDNLHTDTFRVIGGETYCSQFDGADLYLKGYFFDKSGAFIGSSDFDVWQGTKKWVAPINADSVRMRLYNGVGNITPSQAPNVMIRLDHSGWKSNTGVGYEPYWQDTLPLPIISKYFPDGMKKAGSAHDEVRFNKASGKWEYSKGKIKSVDLGDVALSYSTSDAVFNFLLSDLKQPDTYAERSQGAICSRYFMQGVSVDTMPDKAMMRFQGGLIYIKDSDYTDVASFKAAMQGVILYYESNDWEWVELDAEDQNFRDYYNVADFGTEQSQSSVPSAAFSADIIYQFNAVDMIREHELEITELQKVIATMQAQLTSLINGVA